jgi:hypothetical protein
MQLLLGGCVFAVVGGAMLRRLTGLIFMFAAAMYTNGADAHWRRNCPIPTDVAPVWGSSPIIGWQYPCHKVMQSFAPATCWKVHIVETPFGLERRRTYICR